MGCASAVPARSGEGSDRLARDHAVAGLDLWQDRLIRHAQAPEFRVIDHQDENRLPGDGTGQGHGGIGDRPD